MKSNISSMPYSKTLPIGSILHGAVNEYRIDKILGQGSFGITYLASTRMKGPLGEVTVQVALKEFYVKELDSRLADGTVTVRTEEGIGHKYAKAFQLESENLSKMKHPGIVNVLEAFEAKGTYYYSMEYLSGGNLNDKVKGKGIPEPEALSLIEKIGQALSFMHERKMMHLDLKPKNIMLKGDGTPVIIDFGLSKQFDEKGEPESSSTIGMGTPGYAPLEQANQTSGRNFQPTLDIYALGATLFNILTGKEPPNATEILNDGFPEKDLRAKSVTENTIRAIEKAMSATKKNRPQSVGDFLALLSDEETIVTGPSTGNPTPTPTPTPGPSPTPAPTPKPPRRGFWIAALASFVAALAVALLLFLPRGGSSSVDSLMVDSSRECTVEFENTSADREFEIVKNFEDSWTYSGMPEWGAASASSGKFNLSVTENKTKEPRTATVVFRKKGAKDILAKLVITQKGMTSETAGQENAQPGSARINSSPSGAQIWLDGKNTKKVTPEIIENLSAGRHSVKLVLEGYEDYSGFITITSGKRTELSRTLTEKAKLQSSSQNQSGAVQSSSGSSFNPGESQIKIFILSATRSTGNGYSDLFVTYNLIKKETVIESNLPHFIKKSVQNINNIESVNIHGYSTASTATSREQEIKSRHMEDVVFRALEENGVPSSKMMAFHTGGDDPYSFGDGDYVVVEILYANVKNSTDSTYGHDWVDLGLSVKWATCNVGASSPSGYGNYYAWGETSTKSDYSWSTLKYCADNTGDNFTKYNTMTEWGTVDNKRRLERADDGAHASWGGTWRMPTEAEWTELRTKSTWTWTNGGYKVTGPNGNSIFLPAAGYRDGTSLYDAGSKGYYWSSSLYTDGPYSAMRMRFDSGEFYRGTSYRFFGYSVRPVTE